MTLEELKASLDPANKLETVSFCMCQGEYDLLRLAPEILALVEAANEALDYAYTSSLKASVDAFNAKLESL